MNIKSKKFCAKAEKASRLLKTMANAHRLMILCRLHEGEACVTELESIIPLTQSALSQHLAKLRKEGLVTTRREAQTIYYQLSHGPAVAMIQQLYGLYCHAR